MLRRLQWSLVLGVWGVAIPAAAQESKAEFPEEQKPAATDAASAPAAAEEEETAPEQPAGKSSAEGRASAEVGIAAAAPAPSEAKPEEAKPEEKKAGWETFVSGYFRAPMAIGISNRAHPTQANAPTEAQYSYAPNLTID